MHIDVGVAVAAAPASTSGAAARREAQTKALGEVQQGVRVGGCYYVLLTYYYGYTMTTYLLLWVYLGEVQQCIRVGALREVEPG